MRPITLDPKEISAALDDLDALASLLDETAAQVRDAETPHYTQAGDRLAAEIYHHSNNLSDAKLFIAGLQSRINTLAKEIKR